LAWPVGSAPVAVFNRTGYPRFRHRRGISVAPDRSICEAVFGFGGIACDGPMQHSLSADLRRKPEGAGIEQHSGTSLGETFANTIVVPRSCDDEKRLGLVCIEPGIGRRPCRSA
jgi:hypothetical protein